MAQTTIGPEPRPAVVTRQPPRAVGPALVLAVSRGPRSWLAGLVVGLLDGVLFFLWPTLALGLFAGFVLVAALGRSRLRAWSGGLAGAGTAWLVLLIRSVVACSQFDALPGSECVQPDLTGWVVAAAAMVVAGGALVVIDRRRARRR